VHVADGQAAVGVLVVQAGQRHLSVVALARTATRGLAGGLHGGKEQSDEDADDGDHDQELNKRKRRPSNRV
jgi:hypothetical protein